MRIQFRIKIDSRKLPPSLAGSFLTDLTFFWSKWAFFPEIPVIAGSADMKKKIFRLSEPTVFWS